MKDIKLTDEWEIDPFETVEAGEEMTQCIAILLNTEQGDFVLEPEMGLTLENLLYEYDEERARVDIISALTVHEPRITGIDEVRMTHEPYSGHLEVQLNGIQADIGTLTTEVAVYAE